MYHLTSVQEATVKYAWPVDAFLTMSHTATRILRLAMAPRQCWSMMTPCKDLIGALISTYC